jgi:hypothetical protein
VPRLTILLAVLSVLAQPQPTLAAACPQHCRTTTNVAGTTRTVCRQTCPPYRTTTCTSTTNVAGTTRTRCR